MRILTWHLHGSYLDSLVHTGHEFFLPVVDAGGERRGGIGHWGWPSDRVHEVPEAQVPGLDVDVVLFQSRRHWREDGPRILSARQLAGPRIYVEHDPPWDDPTDERHPVDDPQVLLVHVTAFNDLMWDSGRTSTHVIEHGVADPGIRWTGELERGLVVVNNLASRGRRLGLDIFEQARSVVPLDVVGMDAEALGGLGEVRRGQLPAFAAPYRFFFHPIRYTSFGMAVCEALMLGMPVVALATTEMPTVLEDGRSGIVHTDPARLIEGARALLADPAYARRLGEAGRAIALERFSIERFCRDWDVAFREVVEAFREGRVPAGRTDRRRGPPEAATRAADARRPQEVPA